MRKIQLNNTSQTTATFIGKGKHESETKNVGIVQIRGPEGWVFITEKELKQVIELFNINRN